MNNRKSRQQSIWQACYHAANGIIFSIKTERNMKIHVIATIVALGMAWWLQLNRYEMIALVLVISGVLVAEMFNISIEKIVDLSSPGIHPLAKAAKDVAAGAVLWMACTALIVGYLLIAERLGK